jgi:uncharacterized protein
MTPRRQGFVDQWDGLRHSFAPSPEELDETIETMRGDWDEVLRANVKESVGMHPQAVPFMLFWRAMVLMLIGMGLMKTGVFTGRRSRSFYRNWVVAGFGIGLPVIAFGIWLWNRHDFDFTYNFMVGGQFNYFVSVLVCMGYVGVVMPVCQWGGLAGLRARLAAVGRMALTNYLMQSIIGILIFNGYGLGLFGQVERFHLWWFILGIWIVQLVYSPRWLRRFQFGPAEWLWRSLTYQERQSMRIAGHGTPPAGALP